MLGLKPVILPIKLNQNSNPANEVLELYVSEIVGAYIFLAIGICFYYDFLRRPSILWFDQIKWKMK